MLEFYKYITSDLFVFLGAISFTTSVICSIGWSVNAILLGFKGVRCENPLSSDDD